MNNPTRTLFVAGLALALSGCTMIQPGKPTFRSTYNRGDLEFSFEGVNPGSQSLRVNDHVRAQFAFKNLTGKPFRFWAMPYKSSGGYTQGGCYEASGEITAREGTIERFVTACQSPNEAITEIRIKAVTTDQSITLYEGVISNVNYRFSN